MKHLAINKNKSYRGSYKIKVVPDCHPLYVQSYLIIYCGDEESDCSLYTGVSTGTLITFKTAIIYCKCHIKVIPLKYHRTVVRDTVNTSKIPVIYSS